MFRGLLLALTVLLTLVPTVAAENCTTTVATAAPDTMYPNAWLTVASIIAMLIALSVGIIDCAPAMVVTTTFLYLCGVISITDLLAGLSNTSVITIALLFICVDPIAELPLVKKVVSLCLKGGAGTRMPLFKIVLMCLLTSSFLNNAPQVAMLTTMIKFYCRENKLYPSQLLMPMNFATLCGNYAIIGTSTNLIVDGLMQKYGLGPMPFFELIKINGPFTIVMLAYLVFMPKYLLPYRTGLARAKVKDTKAVVLVLARVLETSSLINHTVQEMVVRAAAEAPLAVLQIKRWPDAGVERSHAPFEPSGRSFSGNPTPINGSFFDPTQPRVFFPLTGDEVIQAGDFLTLQTTAEELTGLAAPFGLQWSTMQIAGSPRARDGGDFEMEVEVDDKTHDAADTRQILPAMETMPQGPATAGLVAVNQDHTEFFEVVVSQRCPLVGEHIGSGAFARRYRASPVSLRRLEHDDVTTGETLAEHALQAGDTLLLLANTTFGVAWKDTKEFLVINPIVNPTAEDEVEPVRFYLPNCFPCGNPVGDKDEDRKKEIVLPVWFNYIMVLIFLTMISCAIAGYDLTTCALLAVIAIVTLGIITAERAISLIEMEVLIMVAFSFGLGSAMEKSGFAAFLGGQLKAAHVSGIGLLYLIAVLTTIMTNVITNKACVQVLVPLIVAIYHQQGKCALPPVMMCCALASMALSTPQGFATNLMVMGPGGYQPFDFIKFGLPLNLLGTAIIPLITAGVYQMEW